MMRVLLLGGTTEATALAHAFAKSGIDAVFSYAGRTANPIEQPLPTRLGGYGGVKGLADYIIDSEITHVVDATHPFATQISRNAVDACKLTDTPLIAHERPQWLAQPGDNWHHVADTEAAVAALPAEPARIFLAIGKQTLALFAAQPQHFYLLRLVDAPDAALPLPNAEVILDRGPFTVESDMELMRTHAITHIVAKNSGGSGALAKLEAARRLHLPVILIARPNIPDRPMARSIAAVMEWLGHSARLGV
jgi:precorrin-6A/cobalt-precorrin-6A reductase